MAGAKHGRPQPDISSRKPHWTLVIELLEEGVELGLLLEDIGTGGRVASFFRVRYMRSCRPFCCGWPGRMRSRLIPSRSYHTERLERLKRPWGEANGTPLSERIACSNPCSRNQRSKARKARSSLLGSMASQSNRPGGVIGDG
jgi:hypothetical protein